MTVYAIGDIHGCLDELHHRLAEVAADAGARGAGRPRLVFLGDYVDRGPDSRGVLDLLSSGEIERRFAPVFLLGNHDLMPLAAIDRALDADELRGWLAATGGAETLESYGVDLRRQGPERFLRDFAARLPARHADFLRNLRPCWREPGLFFSHAGADPDTPLDAQTVEALTFGDRRLFEFDHLWLAPRLRDRLGARLVHGHWRGIRPAVWPHRIGVDTGAGFPGGRLSAVAIEGDAVRVLP